MGKLASQQNNQPWEANAMLKLAWVGCCGQLIQVLILRPKLATF